jgi:hypothetical protein
VGIGFTIGSAGVETGAFAGSVLLAAGVTGVTGLVTGISFVVGADTAGAGETGAGETADFGWGGFPPSGAAVSGGRVADIELFVAAA